MRASDEHPDARGPRAAVQTAVARVPSRSRSASFAPLPSLLDICATDEVVESRGSTRSSATTQTEPAQGSGAPGEVWTLEMPPVSVSSTEVRETLARGGSLSELVPARVAEYIEKCGLYRGTGSQ